MDIGNVIVMSGTSLTIYSKAFKHPAYQMPASFGGEGTPIEALAFSLFTHKISRSRIKTKSEAGSISIAIFSLLLFG
jgi:hypothetical protein